MRPDPKNSGTAPEAKPRGRFWLLLVAFMAAQLLAWTLWFIIAAHHPVAEVPLAGS